jgi:CheY-like chemotaxis protein
MNAPVRRNLIRPGTAETEEIVRQFSHHAGNPDAMERLRRFAPHLNVLVVAANKQACEGTYALLAPLGFRSLDCFTNETEATEAYRQKDYHLLFVDVQPSETAFHDFVEVVRSINPEQTVIALCPSEKHQGYCCYFGTDMPNARYVRISPEDEKRFWSELDWQAETTIIRCLKNWLDRPMAFFGFLLGA